MSNSKTLSVTEMLISFRDGGALEELASDLRALVCAVDNTGKAGKLVLQFDVKKNGSGMVAIKDTIKSTLPLPDKGDELFYITEAGGLSRKNPAQMELSDLKDVK